MLAYVSGCTILEEGKELTMPRRTLHRPRAGLVSLLAISGMLLAACQPSPAAPAATTAPAAAPAATTAPAAAAPAGSGEPIKIGFSAGMSGPNAPLGSDQERGGAVAVDEIKTLLGRPLVWVPRDDKNDPGEAAKQAEQLVSNDKVDMLTGCVSAATTLAINQVAKRAGLIYMGTCQTNNLNDAAKDFSETTFHMALTPWMNQQMLLPWITQNLGKKMYIIISDYAWGHENLDSVTNWLQKQGLEPVGSAKAPFPTPDFSPFIPQIRAAAPEVLVEVHPGVDQANFLKQATQFGLTKEIKIFIPVVDTVSDKADGQQNIVDTYGGANFHFDLAQKLPSAQKFVDEYSKKYNGDMPSGYAAYQYNAVKAWAEAAQAAGSIDAKAVAAKLEGMQFDYSVGKSFIRKCDHQLFQPVHIMKGRAETKGAWGFRDLVLSIDPDEKYARTCDELGQSARR
jgi:branched-chain amino acid transport system substrate-binding protein